MTLKQQVELAHEKAAPELRSAADQVSFAHFLLFLITNTFYHPFLIRL